MFDGHDCCGYDQNDDGYYDGSYDIAPGDTALCTECLCKGACKFKKLCTSLEKGSLQTSLINWKKIK